jgi:opacity protein-like surface antigen
MTISLEQLARRSLACVAVVAAIAAVLPASIPSASAADMPIRPAPQVVERPLWTGFYIGVHGGGGWGSTRVEDPNFQLTYGPVSIKSSGALAGAQVGANWQFGSVVIGGEIDASWMSVRGDVAAPPAFPFSAFETKFRALATGTARLGYAAGPWLVYAKGGVAWADIAFTTQVGTPFPRVVAHNRTGLTAGAGLEVAFWQNVSAKLEYNAVYFGETSMSIGSNQGPSNVDHLLHVVKGGFNVRFGGDTVVARY